MTRLERSSKAVGLAWIIAFLGFSMCKQGEDLKGSLRQQWIAMLEQLLSKTINVFEELIKFELFRSDC